LVDDVRPELTQLPGVGVLSAAQTLISWSHHGRLRSEADPTTRAYITRRLAEGKTLFRALQQHHNTAHQPHLQALDAT